MLRLLLPQLTAALREQLIQILRSGERASAHERIFACNAIAGAASAASASREQTVFK